MARIGLVVPAQTYRAEPYLKAAARLGAEVVTISDAPQAFASSAPDRFLEVPLDHPVAAAGKILAFAKRVPLDAVVAIDDVGALAAAYAASRLGLVHNDPQAVRATRDKEIMRERLYDAGVHQPEFVAAHVEDDEFLEMHVGLLADEIGYPVVIKPTSLSGSRGVIRADNHDAARAAARRVRTIAVGAGEDALAPLLIERYIEGAEVAFEARLRDGRLEPLAIFDKPDPLTGPFFEETIYVTPSRLSPELQDAVATTVQAACDGLRLQQGPIHAELRIQRDDDGEHRVVFLELAARTIGGRCAKALVFDHDRSLEELVLADALGIASPPAKREPGASGVMMLPIRHRGRLVAVGGTELALAVEGVVGLDHDPDRRVLVPLPEGDRYLGFIFARGDDPEQVTQALRRAEATLSIEVAPIGDDGGTAP